MTAELWPLVSGSVCRSAGSVVGDFCQSIEFNSCKGYGAGEVEVPGRVSGVEMSTDDAGE